MRNAFLESLESRTLLSRALGLDVSHYQTISSWSSVKASGRDFVWSKSTEGFTYNDPSFVSNITGARAAGLLSGAYHYARYDNNTATAEVQHFLQVAGPYLTAGYLTPVLDVEQSTTLSRAQVSQWVNDWCNGVLSATGIRPIVYTYPYYAQTYLDSTVTQWPLWMANYNGQNPQMGNPISTGPWAGWNFWQYSSTGGVSGISGNVDLDVFNSDAAALQSFVIKPPASITGIVFNDTDGDGVTDSGEAGIANRTVYIDLDNDKILDGNEKRTTTNSNGVYSFSALDAGKYKVRQVLPSGWRQTTPKFGYGWSVSLSAGQSATGRNFGATQKVLISGGVFNDADSDGTKDSGEARLSGFTVYVDKNLDGKLDAGDETVLSDSSGNWSFHDLSAGTWVIRIASKAGYTRTAPSGGKFTVTLSSGSTSSGRLFGEHRVS